MVSNDERSMMLRRVERLQARSDAVRNLLGRAGVLLVAGLLGAPLDSLVKAILLRGASVLLRGGHGYSSMDVVWEIYDGEQEKGASALHYIQVPGVSGGVVDGSCHAAGQV